jgi:uncharacterized protein YbjQ (UPF0145 family)
MEEMRGVKGVTSNGVFFAETAIPNATTIRHLHVEISRQNSNLDAVKQRLASDAKNAGANAVMNFRYGQRAHGLMDLLSFKWDTESWYGEGDAVRV